MFLLLIYDKHLLPFQNTEYNFFAFDFLYRFLYSPRQADKDR